MTSTKVCVAFAVALAGCSSTLAQPAETSWAKVYQVASDARLSAIWAGENQTDWTAGGKDILVVATAGKTGQRGLAGLAIMAFGAGLDGSVYAVGSHGTIWKRVDGADWREECQLRPPGSKGKVRDEALLSGVHLVQSSAGATLVAYGPRSLVLVRDDSGHWNQPTDGAIARSLARSVMFGPHVNLPAGCDLLQWQWLGTANGWFMCHDRRSFAVTDGVLTATSTVPRTCSVLWSVAQWKQEFFASCGDDGELYRLSAGTWKRVPEIRGVRALAANNNCVYAAADKAVWQHCGPENR